MTMQDNAAAMQATVEAMPTTAANKPHISPSRIGSYLRCGEAYRRYYLEKERFPPALAMLLGTGMHEAAHVNFAQKKTTHEDMPLADIVAAAVAAFDKKLDEEGVTLQSEDKALGEGVAVGQARDDVASLAAAFATMQAPHYQPIETELPVRIEVKRGEHDLYGIIDLVATIDNQPGHRLRDFKNSTRKKSALDSAESTQLTFYAAAHRVHFGTAPADVGLDVLVRSKAKKTIQRQELPTQRDQDDFKALANTLNAVEAGLKAGIFLPSIQDKSAWWCSAKFCNYHATCPFVNAKRVNAALAGDSEE